MAEGNFNTADISEEEEEDTKMSDESDLKVELSVFRAQWMSELAPSTGNKKGLPSRSADLKRKQELAREEKASKLFLKAVEQEQNGAVYEAIKYYRRAMQLVPDIEFRINYTRSTDSDGVGMNYLEETDTNKEIDDLLSYFQQQLNLQEACLKICQPDIEMTQTHISALPIEVLMYIFRWVVSSDLDLRALEQLSLVCRGFYICARDPEIWRLACLRVWGRSCTKMIPFNSWREMFLERPRVRFDGVYISKTNYIRQGEQSLDGFYRAWHQVEYYRYFRFFPDGQVMMLTTPEDPVITVTRLHNRNARMESLLYGHYRLSQDTDNQTKVFAVVSKKKEEYPAMEHSNGNRNFRSWLYCTKVAFETQYTFLKAPEYHKNRYYNRCSPVQEAEHSFHMGLQLSSGGRQRFNKLNWIHHSCQITYRSTDETVVTAFDIDTTYTPLFFARVKSYTSLSEKPL